MIWIALKSSVAIFWALEPLQPHWPHRPWQPHWPQQPLQPYITKELPDTNCWIIPGTKMTNTGPFLWIVSSKIQFFTDICYSFCSRLLRPADITFFKTDQ